MRIVHVAAEVDPFFRSGGLGIVAGALPRAQKELGYDVSIVAPFYEKLLSPETRKQYTIEPIDEKGEFYRGVDNGIAVYFVANKKFFGSKKALYGKKKENARFYFFDMAVLALLKHTNLQPDILHCHDWHTGLIPQLVKSASKTDAFWEKTATVYTIHNLAYQMGRDYQTVLPRLRDVGQNGLPPLENTRAVERINFAKRGILHADVINTVSETYREEIFTKDFGEDLQRILKNRAEIVFGIVNGIDYDAYNPLSDPGLAQHYSDKSIERKAANKEWLQRHVGFRIEPDVPLICMTSRIAEQKGYELVRDVIESVLRQNVQWIIMGNGERDVIKFFEKIQRRHPKHFRIMPFDAKYETSLYAGSDIMLLPSRFEPCGINQMIALRYGCIPVVHHIGGLVDTVEDYDVRAGTGNGFVFHRYDADNLLIAITRAIETYKHHDVWVHIASIGMREANSWRLPAQKYIDLYKTARKLHAHVD